MSLSCTPNRHHHWPCRSLLDRLSQSLIVSFPLSLHRSPSLSLSLSPSPLPPAVGLSIPLCLSLPPIRPVQPRDAVRRAQCPPPSPAFKFFFCPPPSPCLFTLSDWRNRKASLPSIATPSPVSRSEAKASSRRRSLRPLLEASLSLSLVVSLSLSRTPSPAKAASQSRSSPLTISLSRSHPPLFPIAISAVHLSVISLPLVFPLSLFPSRSRLLLALSLPFSLLTSCRFQNHSRSFWEKLLNRVAVLGRLTPSRKNTCSRHPLPASVLLGLLKACSELLLKR